MRQFLILVHRYVGLMLVPFLVIVGLTGSILAFYHELDRGLNPELLTVPVPTQSTNLSALDPFILRDRIERQWPHVRVDHLKLHYEPDEAYRFLLVPRINPETGERFALTDNEVFFNPYTGERIGARDRQAVSLAKENIMPFLHRLHWSLALPEHLLMFGAYTLGAAALLWFFDCFAGFYLTLHLEKNKRHSYLISGSVGNLHGRSNQAASITICIAPAVCGCGRCCWCWPGRVWRLI